MMRRIAAALLFAALLAAGARLPILRLLLPPHRPPDVATHPSALQRQPLRFTNDPTPQEMQRFFEGVRANTKPGERIVLIMPVPFEGMGYAHWRASYTLSGRHVSLPDPEQGPKDADVLAVWATYFGDPRYELAWLEGKGAMLRRKP